MIPNKNGAKGRAFKHWSRDRWEAQVARTIRRFWERVDRTDGCWEWQGAVASNGYGTVSFLGRSWTAPRLSYWLMNGYMPEGTEICHRCDNKLCVRPDHLYAGTRSQNLLDLWERHPPRRRRGAA